jgi:Ca2+-binding RTX toxin-like protein
MTVSVAEGESVAITRNGEAIAVNGTACDVATVTTTDLIAVNSTGTPTEVSIDQTGGRFEPGFTTEPDGASEIEFTVNLPVGTPTLRVIGTAEADGIVVGASGINLNAAEATGDADVTATGTPAIVVESGDGDDALSVAGGAGTGEPGPGAALHGQEGADLLVAGNGGSAFDGGGGTDTADFVVLVDGVAVDLAEGIADGVGSDTLEGVENVIGSPGPDEIIGDAAANVLAGGDGDDTIDGGAEADTLLGGNGRDTVSFASASAGVTANLKAGTAEGDGADTVDGFEDVLGSRRSDVLRGNGSANLVDGGGGKDEIHGGNGNDELLGDDGNDLLFGDKGKDDLKGENGKDQLNGGDGRDRCKGGPDPDSFVNCENI